MKPRRHVRRNLIIALAVVVALVLAAVYAVIRVTNSPKYQMAQAPAVVQSTLPAMVNYDQGVTVESASDTAKLVNTSPAFKLFVADTLQQDNASFQAQHVSCWATLTIKEVYQQQYATGEQITNGNCFGDDAVLWGVVQGAWTEISSSKDVTIPFSCTDLATYNVPSAIAGTTCFNTASGQSMTYNP